MESRIARIIVISAVVAAGAVTALLLCAPAAFAQGLGQPIVELRSDAPGDLARAGLFAGQRIAGTDSITKQKYKFQRERQGKDFSYAVANLEPSTGYLVELSFVEHDQSASGRRIFDVYLQGAPFISKLDIYARAGKNKAYQQTFFAYSDSAGLLTARFTSLDSGCKDYATVSTVRIYRGTSSAVEINAAASRLTMNVPARFSNGAGQDSFETVLGRLGSRFSLDLLPQKLSARFSSLGDGTGDLSDLVMALADDTRTNIRALPFTDRFTVWESMTFEQTMTRQRYTCSSTQMPFEVTVDFRSPFYPGEEQLSGAPFFYVDVTVRNTGTNAASPSFLFARPNKQDFAKSSLATFDDGTKTGYQGSTVYGYYDETSSVSYSRHATEALAVSKSEQADVAFRGAAESEFTDFTADSLWGYASPAGYPRTYSDYKNPVFSFYPRGYTGAVWTPALAAAGQPGDASTKHFVMAGYVPDRILHVKNSSYDDGTFKFKYNTQFASLGEVVDYAVTGRAVADQKADFFDSTVSSDSYLSLPASYGSQVKNLMAYSFQSYLMNTWWAQSQSTPSREWFSVWEGSSCRFHSTIDVEYNDAWFYFDYWPDLLKKTMDEWVLYQKTAQQGTYLSHDMGLQDEVTGQAYPGNMAVEENTDFILLLYKYWKTTGDKGYMGQQFPLVAELVDFIANCDSNKNGIPDQYVTNTVDQGSLAIQNGKDQSYLGTKCLAAYQAAREMALSLPSPDLTYADKCRAQVESINQTLDYDMWLSDHFAVCVDDDVLAADREAYSIYPSNGLLYLLSGTRAAGLTSTNTERMRTDLVNSTDKTLKAFGCTHSSYDAYNEWVSQNIWRDQVACHLGASLNGDNPLAMTSRYWNLEQYYAKSLWGSWWDVVVYPGGTAGGASASNGGSGRSEGSTGSGRTGGGSDGGASSYQQSLGYYPRGAASLGLPDAVAGLTLDYPDSGHPVSARLYYRQTTGPLRVPVLSRADWGNPNESLRVPTLYFADASSPPVPTNPGLLPVLAPLKMVDMTAVSGGDHAISPNSDGVNDSATVSYNLPQSAEVTASIWEGSNLIKSFGASVQGSGPRSFTWDGRNNGGEVVADGVYTASIEARATDASFEIRPASAPVYVNNTIPELSTTWYLAEGFTGTNATGGNFEEYVLIQNPDAQPANVQVTFMMPGGRTEQHPYVVPATSRLTVSVDDLLPDAEVSTYIQSDRPVAAERAMYFNGRKAGHDSIGVSHTSKTWYLAEGYTAGNFDEYVLIQNPGSKDAQVTASFMTASTGNKTKQYTVGPHSRFTIHVDDIVPADSVSTEIKSSEPVVVERAQYLNDMTAGTASIGAVSMSRTWYLAEGYTDQGFETWVLIQNPQRTYNNVTVTFMEKDGSSTVKQYLLTPQSRFSILVDGYLPASEVSTKVRSQDPVIVERAMYWNDRSDGHDSIGTPTPDSEWYLAEGYTGGGFETYVLVQNPADDTRNVTMTFMEPGGRNTTRTYRVPPRSRFSVGVNNVLPDAEFSTRVRADGPVIVERAVYFNGRSGGTDSIGIR